MKRRISQAEASRFYPRAPTRGPQPALEVSGVELRDGRGPRCRFIGREPAPDGGVEGIEQGCRLGLGLTGEKIGLGDGVKLFAQFACPAAQICRGDLVQIIPAGGNVGHQLLVVGHAVEQTGVVLAARFKEMGRAAGGRYVFGDGGENAAVLFVRRHDINAVA